MSIFVNLLPISVQRRQLLQVRLRQWMMVWSAGALMLTGSWFYQQLQLHRAESRFHAVRAAYLPLQRLESETKELRSSLREMERRQSLALELLRQPPVLLMLSRLSLASAQCEGSVCIEQLVLSRPATGQPAPATAPATLLLRGVGIDHGAVARFVEQLRDPVLWKQVELKSAGPASGEYAGARAYHVQCTLN